MLKSLRFVLVLSLLLPLAQAGVADAKPTTSHSSSFKSGFSSKSSSSKSSSHSKSSSGFGAFSRRSAAAPADNGSADGGGAASKPSGGFGAFGRAAAAPQRSDSALSRKLDQDAAQANALRTLDARRQAQDQARNQAARDTRPVPGYEQAGQPAGMAAPAPVPAQAPIIVRQDSGIGNVIAGAVLANAAHRAHANNGYPGSGGGSIGNVGTSTGAPSSGGSALGGFLHLVLWLCVLSALGWGIYVVWRRVQRRRAANKPNYSFERN